VRFGSFCNALKMDILKYEPWFAFSKNPLEIAHAVMDVASQAESIIPTDFSRFDGTISEGFHKYLRRPILLRYFAQGYHTEVAELTDSQRNCRARTANGVTYNTGWTVLSGSADTSDFNSIANAFVAYFMWRESGFDAKTSWYHLSRCGLYGGDDGITAGASSVVYERVAFRLGLKLKAELVQQHQPVPFLGRFFIDPWVQPDSIADVLRQARKLHLSNADPAASDKVALLRKATGYMQTDASTPVLGDWARAIIRIVGRDTLTARELNLTERDQKWYLQWDIKFPQQPASDLIYSLVAESLGITVGDVEQVIDMLKSASTFDEIQPIIPEANVKIEVPASMAGRIVEPITDPSDLTKDINPKVNKLPSKTGKPKCRKRTRTRRRGGAKGDNDDSKTTTTIQTRRSTLHDDNRDADAEPTSQAPLLRGSRAEERRLR
jgi:hypothetical protein